MLNIVSIASLGSGILLIFFVSWLISGSLSKLSRIKITDFGFLMMIAFLLLSRGGGLLYFAKDVVVNGWSLSPVTETQETILFLNSWPWAFLKFSDGFFFIFVLFPAVVLAEMIFGVLHRVRHSSKEKIYIYRYGLITGIMALLPFIGASYFNNNLTQEYNPPLQGMIFGFGMLAVVYNLIIVDRLFFYWMGVVFFQIMSLVAFNMTYVNSRDDLWGLNVFFGLFIIISLVKMISSLVRKDVGKTVPVSTDMTLRKTWRSNELSRY